MRKTHHLTVEQFEEAFRTKRTDAWLALLDAADVPCGAVNFPEEMYENAHVEANGLMLTLEHSVLGTLRMPACPIAMSESETGAYTAPPALGVDGPAILRDLGYDGDAIATLLESGVLYTREYLLERDGPAGS